LEKPSYVVDINFKEASASFSFFSNFVKRSPKDCFKSSISISKSSDDYSADDLSSSLTYSNNNDDGNDRNNSSSDYSLICGEPDNIFQEKEFMNLLRTSTTFPKYAELNDLIECPFEDAFPPEMRLKNYLNISLGICLFSHN